MQTPLKQRLRGLLAPVPRALASAGVSPDAVTLAGLFCSGLAALALALGSRFVALLWMALAFSADVVDGDLARLRPDGASKWGALLDSTTDRLSEALLLIGLLLGKAYHGGGLRWPWVLVWGLAFAGGFLVSYVRARTEGLGADCRVGLAERPERSLLLALTVLLGFRISILPLLLLAVASWFTVWQRVQHARRALGASDVV